VPKMLNYYYLSAIAMEKERVVFYARCWIEHKQLRKRSILAAVFRSKCLHIRYDFVLVDPSNEYSISMLCGVSKMSPYVFLPDVPVDHAAVIEVLSRYICDPDNKLALIPGHPDKDEYGHFIHDGFDPIASALDGVSTGKRTRIQRIASEGNDATVDLKPKRKPKPKKPKAKPKPKPKAKAKISNTSDDVRIYNHCLICTHLTCCMHVLPAVRSLSLPTMKMRRKTKRRKRRTKAPARKRPKERRERHQLDGCPSMTCLWLSLRRPKLRVRRIDWRELNWRSSCRS